MDLQALLTEKWPYKVAAIILSILLWLNVTADQETQDRRISTRVEFVVPDTAWAVSEAQEEVETIFQGRSGDIIALFNAPVITVVVEAAGDSVVEVLLDVADVRYDESLNVRPTAISPTRIFVHLEPRRVRDVPVIPMSDARPAPGFAIDRMVVRPETVRLSGPASAVDPVIGIATEQLEIGELREGVTRLATLERPPGPSSLEITPSQVSLSVEVDSMIVRRFQVTVVLTGDAASSVSVEPAVIRVDVSGAARTVGALSPTDLVASVRVDAVPEAPIMSAVEIELPPDVRARAASDPARVSVRPTNGGGPE